MTSCLFCQIASGDMKTELVYQDQDVVAFRDTSPKAPVHILVIPREHMASLDDSGHDDRDTLGGLLAAARDIARQKQLDRAGYRIVINTGQDGGQTIDHLHLHILGGRTMGWPPG